MRAKSILLVIAALAVVGVGPKVGAGAPLVQILEPAVNFRLGTDDAGAIPVRIRVQAGSTGVRSWRVTARDSSGIEVDVAHGSGLVEDVEVGRIAAAADWVPGIMDLQVEAEDFIGTRSLASVSGRLSSPRYRLIPLTEGNNSIVGIAGVSVSADGSRIARGGPSMQAPTSDLIVFDRATGQESILTVRLGSTTGHGLAPYGDRYFYTGTFPVDHLQLFGLGFRDFGTGTSNLVARDGEQLFSVSRDGRYVAYQKLLRNEDGFTRQYFWQDTETGEERQLTDSPDAVVFTDRPDACPTGADGTVPLIRGDGRQVIIVTGSTLGLAADDPEVGCRVFVYDVATDSWEIAAELPAENAVVGTTLTEDGRWLSLIHSRPVPGGRQGFPALLDLESGVLTDPLANLDEFASFDAVIAYDGRYIVLTTSADLDPRLGNADHNMELFLYDRQSGEIDQITETTGGIGLTSTRCEPYRPRPSADAEVILFGFMVLSVERCRLDGAQRNEVDGFEFRAVRAVRKREGNLGPQWRPPVRAYVQAGEHLEISFSASDPDGDILTFFAQERGGSDVPRGAEMRDWHDGTASFSWPTRPEDTGRYMLRVAVFDEGGGEDWVDLPIAVCSRTLDDGGILAILGALFTDSISPPTVPIECRGADANGDGTVTAADVLAAAGWD